MEKPTFSQIRMMPFLQKIPLVRLVVQEAKITGIVGIACESNPGILISPVV
jgi:hypothetical protein